MEKEIKQHLIPDPGFGNKVVNVVGQIEVGSDGFMQLVLMDAETQQTQVMHLHRYPRSESDKKSWAAWDAWIFLFKNFPHRMMDEPKR